MSSPDQSKEIVGQMLRHDHFSRWLGIELLELTPGSCVLTMSVRKDMLNGFGIAHGGITYSLADSALAFASNGHGRKCVSVETSISHTAPITEGDTIIARATENFIGNKTAIYDVRIEHADGKLIALFRGTVYRTSKIWETE